MKEGDLVECGWKVSGKKCASVLLALLLAGSAFADEVKIVEGGVARCRVVVSEDASASERFGGKLSDTGRLYEKLTVRGTGATGHLMSTMLLGENSKAAAERRFAAHPDYFPLINGERRMIWAHNDPNPCVSNPAVLDIMAANLAKWLGGEHGSEAYCEIGNNDTTLWCQCETCKALDPPETAGTRGELSDRYWWFVNELAKRVWREVPQAKICGASQTFGAVSHKVELKAASATFNLAYVPGTDDAGGAVLTSFAREGDGLMMIFR